jgi:hypothetical protein
MGKPGMSSIRNKDFRKKMKKYHKVFANPRDNSYETGTIREQD